MTHLATILHRELQDIAICEFVLDCVCIQTTANLPPTLHREVLDFGDWRERDCPDSTICEGAAPALVAHVAPPTLAATYFSAGHAVLRRLHLILHLIGMVLTLASIPCAW